MSGTKNWEDLFLDNNRSEIMLISRHRRNGDYALFICESGESRGKPWRRNGDIQRLMMEAEAFRKEIIKCDEPLDWERL